MEILTDDGEENDRVGSVRPMRISASRHTRARGVNACTGTCHAGPIRNLPVFNIYNSLTKLDKHKKWTSEGA